MSLATVAMILLLATSCDYIEEPFFQSNDTGIDTTDNPRKVMVFDFTGHTCKSCPKAHQAIDQMKELFGDRLIPVAFHLGYFAKPQTGTKFTTDFRTPEGAILENYFEFVSFPIGTVQNLNKDRLIPCASWAAEAGAGITGNAPVRISFINEYLAGINSLGVEFAITFLSTLEGTYKYAIYLIEDKIIDWQKDEDFDPMDILDYEHNHVFRTSFNSVWGQPVREAGPCEKGFVLRGEIYKQLDPDWNAANCSVVVFVYRDEDKQVIQAERKKVIGD